MLSAQPAGQHHPFYSGQADMVRRQAALEKNQREVSKIQRQLQYGRNNVDLTDMTPREGLVLYRAGQTRLECESLKDHLTVSVSFLERLSALTQMVCDRVMEINSKVCGISGLESADIRVSQAEIHGAINNTVCHLNERTAEGKYLFSGSAIMQAPVNSQFLKDFPTLHGPIIKTYLCHGNQPLVLPFNKDTSLTCHVHVHQIASLFQAASDFCLLPQSLDGHEPPQAIKDKLSNVLSVIRRWISDLNVLSSETDRMEIDVQDRLTTSNIERNQALFQHEGVVEMEAQLRQYALAERTNTLVDGNTQRLAYEAQLRRLSEAGAPGLGGR